MALNERLFVSAPLNQYMVDKDTGLPLAGGTIEFFRDADRNTKKDVYQLTGSFPNYSYTLLPNPIVLSSVGTVENNSNDNEIIYFFPYEGTPDEPEDILDLYYIVCKSSTGVVQWTREAWPNIAGGLDPIKTDVHVENEITNSQFSRTFLNPNSANIFNFTAASLEVVSFAPDWDMLVSGTGSVTLEIIPIAGVTHVVTNPSNTLKITVGAGISACVLRQRFNKNSGLFASSGNTPAYLSGFFVARKDGVGVTSIELSYDESLGLASPIDIINANVSSDYSSFSAAVEIPQSSNSQTSAEAYVDILVTIPVGEIIEITSVQVAPTNGGASANILPFDEISSNRDLARMGDYFLPNLEKKQIESFLIGWDFPQNPGQFGDSGSVGTNTAEYILDQTIAQTSSTATLTFAKNSATNGLELNHGVADQSYALIQYLSNEDASKILSAPLSVNVAGYTRAGGNPAENSTIQIKLFANASASQFGTLPTTIVDLNANGAATLTSTAISNGWYEIERGNLPTATANLEPLTDLADISSVKDLGFIGWNIKSTAEVTAGVLGFAIVVSIIPATSSTDYNTIINSISLVPGNIPTRPAVKSSEETRKECQWYYETSYNRGVTIPTATAIGAFSTPMFLSQLGATSGYTVYNRTFSFSFKTEKRVNPTITFYPVQGTLTANNFTITAYTAGVVVSPSSGANPVQIASTNWQVLGGSTNQSKMTYLSASAAAINSFTSATNRTASSIAVASFHYVADARIGI